MPRTYKKKNTPGKDNTVVSPTKINKMIQKVRKKEGSIRKIAKEGGVSDSTLRKYLKFCEGEEGTLLIK